MNNTNPETSSPDDISSNEEDSSQGSSQWEYMSLLILLGAMLIVALACSAWYVYDKIPLYYLSSH